MIATITNKVDFEGDKFASVPALHTWNRVAVSSNVKIDDRAGTSFFVRYLASSTWI